MALAVIILALYTHLCLPSRTLFSALCLIALPCYQSSQSDHLVIYMYSIYHPFLMTGVIGSVRTPLAPLTVDGCHGWHEQNVL